MRPQPALAGLALAVGVTGCGGGAAPAPADPAAVPSATSTLPAQKGGPLTDLPECSTPPEASGAEVTTDLVLPDGAVVTGVEDLGELVSVRGYVALTPIQVRQFYAAEPRLKVYALEDELYESEVLFGSGGSRVFVKAQAQCRQASVLSVFVGPEDGEGLPSITGR